MTDHPLTAEHKALLDQVCTTCPRALELCEALGQCGIDTSEQQAVLKQQQEMAEKLRSKFFPFVP